MRPTLSIIFFTVMSGAGYGLWFLIGLGLATHWPVCGQRPPPDASGLSLMLCVIPSMVTYGFVAGFVLVSAGLVSSLGHLGQPQRAWRALSQWRSSWLSREGVAALLTFIPAIGFIGLEFAAWLQMRARCCWRWVRF
jgi:DMSO reductase anchor subunit